MSEITLYFISWGAGAWMTAIILVMHFIHYPNFKNITEASFQAFAKQHARNITFIVLPPMLIELICSVFLIYFFASTISWLNFIGVVLLWAITAIKSAPTHTQIAQKFSDESLIELLKWNRWRVVLWSIRLILLSWVCFIR